MIKINSFLFLPIVIIAYLLLPSKVSAQNGEVFAAVKKGNNWGYIDTTGKVRIPFNMEKEGSFQEGIANVKYGNYWGYIDKKGNWVVQPQYDNAFEFESADPF